MEKFASLAYPSPAIYEENERHTTNVRHYTLAYSRESLPPEATDTSLYVTCTYASEEMSERVIVGVKQGDLRGRKVSTKSGLHYYSFQGIPYAKPPVGNLRFHVSCSYFNFILMP
jgi:hypothetical protein